MSLFQRLKEGLAKTSDNLRSKIQTIFQPGVLTDEFLDDLELFLFKQMLVSRPLQGLLRPCVKKAEAAGQDRRRFVPDNGKEGSRNILQ